MPTKKGDYLIKTKIGEDGYAVTERHFSDHGKPSAHSIPHDHIIDWSKGFPYAEKPVNYQQENIPELKFFERNEKQMHHHENVNDFQFENISDFKWCLIYGGEVEFVWNEKIYSITRDSDGKLGIMQIYKDETNQLFNSIDELLAYKLESGEILKDIITKAEISSRTL